MRRVGVWVALVASVLASLAAAVGCWLETSVVGWVTNLAALVVVLVIAVAYDRPGRHLVRQPFAWLYPLCGLVGLASVVRVGRLGWPHISSTAMAVVVFVGVLLVSVVAGLREPGGAGAAVTLAFPLRSGRWAVAVGGTRALNHHLAHPEQVGGLDLIAVRRDGARAEGVCPTRVQAYQAYGCDVLSPCDGLVVEATDGERDHAPHRRAQGPSAGNVVRIACGDTVVQLAHLRPGSLQVVVGDRVTKGQPIAEVGGSGRASEPHLHVHAERDGRGLRLRFEGMGRRLRPGVVVTAAEDVASRT